METKAWTIRHTCTVFSISCYFPCVSHLLPQKESLPTTLTTSHQQPNYQKRTRASVVKSTFNSTYAQQQHFCSDSNIKQSPNKHNIFQKHQQRKQTKKEIEKSSASCPRHSKSENTTSIILLDKETTSPMITPKSIFLLKKGCHTKQVEHSFFLFLKKS